MSMLQIRRDDFSATFFDAAKEGRLLVHRCRSCCFDFEPAARRCSRCQSENVSWIEVSGEGRLVTWAVPQVRNKAKQMVPSYAIAIVELDEGPWLHAHVASDALGVLDVDARVKISFENVPDGESLPVIAAR